MLEKKVFSCYRRYIYEICYPKQGWVMNGLYSMFFTRQRGVVALYFKRVVYQGWKVYHIFAFSYGCSLAWREIKQFWQNDQPCPFKQFFLHNSRAIPSNCMFTSGNTKTWPIHNPQPVAVFRSYSWSVSFFSMVKYFHLSQLHLQRL